MRRAASLSPESPRALQRESICSSKLQLKNAGETPLFVRFGFMLHHLGWLRGGLSQLADSAFRQRQRQTGCQDGSQFRQVIPIPAACQSSSDILYKNTQQVLWGKGVAAPRR